MGRRVNKRGWIVLVSIASGDGMFCVDVFEHPRDGFGFAHFRSDSEDRGAWTLIDVAQRGFGTPTEAAASAVGSVPWLVGHRRAKQALEDWLTTQD